jgi:RNA polymerase sigma-70 factor (ECF subfamily)
VPEDALFLDLIERVRAGDDRAAEELLRRYEPAIRRTVRARLRDASLRRLLDTVDICQAVAQSFFVRVALGRFELNRPEDLLKLLTAMARNKLNKEVHRQRAARRDHRRTHGAPVEDQQPVAAGPTPSQQVAARELLQQAQLRLSAEERRLLELRQEGRSWDEIAALVGGNAEALRKRLARAVDRVAGELGLDEVTRE